MSRRGAATVEFAIVAPVIFLFVFASFEFGRAIMATHGLEAAAREGCREALSWDVTTEDIETKVQNRMLKYGISDYTLTIDPASPTDANQWGPVTVRVSTTYDQISWLPVSRFLRGITLQGSCSLPQESDSGDS